MKQPFGVLRQFIRERAPAEQCELCAAGLAEEHPHLIDPLARQILCACDPCAILFSSAAGTKYKRVPRQIHVLSDFQMTDAQWDRLLIPIGMAFFFYSTADQKIVALYPSPAGPMESLLPLESWNEIMQQNPLLHKMQPDVEALLVNRTSSERGYYLIPIDECYKLVGLIRAKWRGLSGGTEVWDEIRKFFSTLNQRASREEIRA